ncbi:MAG: metallophosphoesterase family protein [Pseudomonadota bacterium]
MLNMFRQRKEPQVASLPHVTRRTYAVGDIHGRFDLLGEIVDRILQDQSEEDGVPEIIFLGDYIDRGERSSEVIEFLIAMQDWPEVKVRYLRGNHEEMMLDFLVSPDAGDRWLRYGGLQTLMSYGVSAPGPVHQPGTLAVIRDDLEVALGAHRAFIEAMGLWHMSGNVLFVHAAADPMQAATQQDPRTLLWGHPRFAERMRDDGVWVVHGHTVVEEPIVEKGRISVDTGAYFSNRLTAVRLEAGKVRFLTAA